MNVPYTIDRREDTGVSNSTMGIWLFLASEVMLFGALFSTYALLRVSAPEWPSGPAVLNVTLGSINTVVLLAATFMAWRKRLIANSVLAAVFLAIKAYEYGYEIAAGLVPSVSTFWAIYFVLTGLHVLHVAGGMVANTWALAGRAGEAMMMSRVRLLALYWTFVDLVWIVLFVLFYLS
jgi:cytochrome c oxidase subunit 3